MGRVGANSRVNLEQKKEPNMASARGGHYRKYEASAYRADGNVAVPVTG